MKRETRKRNERETGGNADSLKDISMWIHPGDQRFTWQQIREGENKTDIRYGQKENRPVIIVMQSCRFPIPAQWLHCH